MTFPPEVPVQPPIESRIARGALEADGSSRSLKHRAATDTFGRLVCAPPARPSPLREVVARGLRCRRATARKDHRTFAAQQG